MDPERWKKLERIFETALDLSPQERERHLEERCGDDLELLAEIRQLLEVDARPVSLLDASVVTRPAGSFGEGGSCPDPMVGARLGAWRIDARLAEGGMGVVYHARRDDERFDIEVAIKVLRRSISSGPLLKRFESEGNVLASLNHPNIARLIDGGTTADGLPYLVMEYIESQPIDSYADVQGLSIPERLRLFATVCRVVHFAHQNLVIHRDLKPSNVVVTPDGMPKLLDFGIAKILDPSGDASPRTETSARMLTPQYASPEQIRGDAITTETDVYSLGVLLYEMLTGRQPYRMTSRAVQEVERAVLEQPARRPSTTLAEDGTPPLELVAERRGLSPGRLRKVLRGDLDNIVLMALRKEPERRYGSAHEFAEDVERYLDGLPVRARRDTVLYLTTKFVQRYRWSVAAAGLVLAFLVTAVIVMSHLAHVAREGQQEAQAAGLRSEHDAEHARIESDSNHQVAQFLTEIVLATRPAGDDLALTRRLVELQAYRARQQYADELHLQANLIDALGKVLLELCLYEEAGALLEEARSIREKEFGPESLEVALSLGRLGEWHVARGDPEQAVTALRRCLELHRTCAVDVHTDVARAANDLAVALRHLGEDDEAAALHLEALELRRAQFGDRSLPVAESLNNLGLVLLSQGDHEAAEQYAREVLSIRRETLGEQHLQALQARNNLAVIWQSTGRPDAAREAFDEAIEGYRELGGAGRDGLARLLPSYATLLLETGDLDGAERALREALEYQRQSRGDDHPYVATALIRHAQLLQQRGRTAEARGQFEEALAIRRARLPEGHRLLGYALQSLGTFLVESGQAEEAEPLLFEALSILEVTEPPDSRPFAGVLMVLGVCLAQVEDDQAAEEYLLEAFQILREVCGESSPDTGTAREHLRQLYTTRGDLERAREFAAPDATASPPVHR